MPGSCSFVEATMTYDDLERAFYARYPEGSFVATSIRKAGAVKVQFRSGALTYTYKGSPEDIARRMSLDKPPKDLNGAAVITRACKNGLYSCQVRYGQDRFGVKYVSVTSPFTGMTVTIREGYRQEMEALWDKIMYHVLLAQRQGVSRHKSVVIELDLADLRLARQVYDRQQEKLNILPQEAHC